MYAKLLGVIQTEKYIITHVEFSKALEDITSGYFETGLRVVKPNKNILPVDFFIIKHGWKNYSLAGEYIVRLFDKGHNPKQILRILNRLKNYIHTEEIYND